MAHETREELIEAYLLTAHMRDMLHPPEDLEEAQARLAADITAVGALTEARYPHGRSHRVAKSGNLHLAWEYAKDPKDLHRFLRLLRISPTCFDFLLSLIEDHPIFSNNSNIPQAPVSTQLAVMLYRMGHYGNAASVEEVAEKAGCSPGSVENYTERCLEAIESLGPRFIRRLSPEEKEKEKRWIEEHLGFEGGTWREGYLMYDGTIVVLFKRPGQNGDAYYTRKGNYGLNLQVGNAPSTLRIVDFAHGPTGAVHDSEAFRGTGAALNPDWLFQGDEFAWCDSAYSCTLRTIPVHKEPASLQPRNAIFDRYVAKLRVRSEHTMGALKGRFPCLRGLRVPIDSNSDHIRACRWLTCAMILHNLVIDVEGPLSGAAFADAHTQDEEEEDTGPRDYPGQPNSFESGEAKREHLIDELMEYQRQRDSS